jgi:hypothetical protein
VTGTMRAMTTPRSVTSISSPRFTRLSTPAVSWFNCRTGTSLMPLLYYKWYYMRQVAFASAYLS